MDAETVGLWMLGAILCVLVPIAIGSAVWMVFDMWISGCRLLSVGVAIMCVWLYTAVGLLAYGMRATSQGGA